MVRKDLPYYDKDGKQHQIVPKHVKILVQQPRLLVVRLTAPGLDKAIAVAHAPHSRASDGDCAAWWEHFSTCATKFRIDHIMIGANGTKGQLVSPRIGDYGEPQDENRGGNHFHAYFREHELAAVNTVC